MRALVPLLAGLAACAPKTASESPTAPSDASSSNFVAIDDAASDSASAADTAAGGGTATAIDDAGAEGGTCQPGNVSGFQPGSFPSADAGSLACSGYGGDGGLVSAYGDACIGHEATFTSCAAFDVPDSGQAGDCFRCLVSPEGPDAGPYGPVVIATVPLVNSAACIEAVDPTPAGAACALAVYEAAACAQYACDPGCPVFDDSSMNAYKACWNAAWSSVCAGYGLSANDCLAEEHGDGGTPVSQFCLRGISPEDDYLSIARLFCGQ